MEKINLDVIINDIKIEMYEAHIFLTPKTIEKGDSRVRLKDFNNDMISTSFIRFLTLFCNERNLLWFVDLDTKSVIIG